ncbi:Dipeptidyl carboxypeptidase [Lysobacter dokdonensis DS-58]|uniref:Dipeptidyl carboxypeptidase n=1 Tax=Lysobacter dokdonensis DS-58 TaxID=1300345 RepID=A0A0A2WN49_9GAMM|nr:M2 family metallopeptidase [Lysobacter dokdonensis]KGQ19680.1 Dipeptidyl carboxypeptidase [Lysobacter dokdonensis DS-58]
MKPRHLLLAVAVSAGVLALAGCKKPAEPAPTHTGVVSPAPEGETADQFVARVNAEMKKNYAELSAAQWLSQTDITVDSELVASKAEERNLTRLLGWIEQSRKYEGQQLSPQTARAIQLLKLQADLPPPKDPAQLEALTKVATKMEGMYGKGTYCKTTGTSKSCRNLGELEDVLRSSRDYDEQLDAWQGWHTVAQPIKADYVKFVELSNIGARDMGYADTGELWRSGYDMTPAQFAADTDRLWGQVKPLYDQLHCYARTQLDAKYGERGEVAGGMLPAHLMGNMWQQDWSNLWDILQPYPDGGDLNVTANLQEMATQDYNLALAQHNGSPTAEQLADMRYTGQLATAKHMTERAEDFYDSLGMPKLPATYWERSQFIKPRDRDVVCHASAWPMDMADDVRTKMCIKPNEEDFTTIYHELGHVYYYTAYKNLPPLFQSGAHDGFHEAIGDTIVLAMTPQYLHSIGLVDEQQQSDQALINAQMRMALANVSFLPFGLMIDRWRWGVFDGSIKPDQYNKTWWDLKAKYQGVAPAAPRGEEFFDAGAKYHVPANTPYTRYFLSKILQFQFYKALCDTAGYKGPLHGCSFYGNKAAGQKFQAMLARGASQPWQATLKEMTGSDKMDAAPVLEYFAPLQDWLKKQNEGKTCGWNASPSAKG